MSREEFFLTIIIIFVAIACATAIYSMVRIDRFIDTFDQRIIVNQNLMAEVIQYEFNNLKIKHWHISIDPNCQMGAKSERIY